MMTVVVVVVVKVLLLQEVDICHKNALFSGLQCLCELPEVRKYPASIT